jgi:hypothetical protein
MDLAASFASINPYNYASLYILKHALGELGVLKGRMERRENIVGSNDWGVFCSSEDYKKSCNILNTLLDRC